MENTGKVLVGTYVHGGGFNLSISLTPLLYNPFVQLVCTDKSNHFYLHNYSVLGYWLNVRDIYSDQLHFGALVFDMQCRFVNLVFNVTI